MNLKWTRAKQRQLIDVANQGRKIPSGSVSCFVRLTPRVAIKLFRRRPDRDMAAERQAIAAAHRLAPRVGDSMVIKLPRLDWSRSRFKVQRFFGYLTEVADVRRHGNKDERTLLKSQLRDIGIVHDDLITGNVGYLNERLVAVDFGAESCYRKRPRIKTNKTRGRTSTIK